MVQVIKKSIPRGVRFSDHAILRYRERFAPYGYSLKQMENDIKRGFKSARATLDPSEYQILGTIGVYIMAKDRISHDRIIITMRMSKKQERILSIKL
jgi:hypothetical protein